MCVCTYVHMWVLAMGADLGPPDPWLKGLHRPLATHHTPDGSGGSPQRKRVPSGTQEANLENGEHLKECFFSVRSCSFLKPEQPLGKEGRA